MAETDAGAPALIAPDALKGRYGSWALIAGGTEGLGRAYADALAAAGINLLLVGRRQALLDSVGAELEAAHGVSVVGIAADLAVPGAADRLSDGVGDRDLGLVVFSAGSDTVCADFISHELSHWSSLIARNVQTLTEVSYRFAGRLAARGRGALLIVCSEASLGGCGSLAIYTATKAYALNFGESLWAELRHQGVDVLSVVVGSTDTPTFRANLAAAGVDAGSLELAVPSQVATESLARLASGPVFMVTELGGPQTETVRRHDRVEFVTGFMQRLLGKA